MFSGRLYTAYFFIYTPFDYTSKEMEFYGALDPSLGKSAEKGDYSAIIVLGRDKEGLLYILEADIARRSVDRQIRDVLAYAQRYKFVQFAIESNMFQEMISQKVEEESRRNGIYLNIKPVNNVRDKLARIQCLYSTIKNGTLQFSRNHKLLLDECRAFPKGRTDDGLDALEMAFSLVKENALNMEKIANSLKYLADREKGATVENSKYPIKNLPMNPDKIRKEGWYASRYPSSNNS